MKTFTLEEAQSLLPLIESLLKRAMESRLAAQQVEARISELGRRIYLAGGMRVNLAEAGRDRQELDGHLQRVKESLAEIDDQVVLLCWRMGETSIEHWHTLEDGFRGRRPLDERFRRRSNSNRPN